MRLSYRTIIAGGRVLKNHAVETENGRIVSLAPCEEAECAEGILIPGLIDIHIHGAFGVDMMQGRRAIKTMAEGLVKYGVTGFLPTTMNAGVDETRFAVEESYAAMESGTGARVLGCHMEGPFLNAAHAGAQRPEANLLPSLDQLVKLSGKGLGGVRLITLAPELKGALELSQELKKMGITVSAGHSAASYELMQRAVGSGVSQVTHIFNGMNNLQHRSPNLPGSALSMDELTVQLIADGVHLHPGIVKLVCRAKGPKGVALITDSLAATGMPDGEYTLGGNAVTVKDGVARIAAGNLAGSTLTMDRAIKNLVAFGAASLEEAVTMASTTPARSIDLKTLGDIAPGMLADFAVLNEGLQVQKTYVGGKEVYSRP